jgi:transcriptional regulator with XRE-family HTH domain
MTEDLDPLLTTVGPRLREVRRRRDVTLDQLAGRTGISVSTLSRLETGRRRLSLELLLPLARAHGIPLDELVGAPPIGDPRVHLRPVRREGSTWIRLSRSTGGPIAFKQIVPVDPRPQKRLALRVHDGHEWLYVIAGRLQLVLRDDEFILGPGEAAEFDTRVPHGLVNVGSEPLELLHLFGPNGERVHLRSR